MLVMGMTSAVVLAMCVKVARAFASIRSRIKRAPRPAMTRYAC